MKKMLFLCLLCVVIEPIYAQEITVSGKVIDQSQTPISEATVIMLSNDSVYLDVAITDSAGLFSFPLIESPFSLLFNHVAYQDTCCTFTHANQVSQIRLEPSTIQIKEITVKAYRPIVQIKEGKLSYNLSQLSEQTTATNVYEALNYLAGVDEEGDAYTLAGMGTVTIIINGKPSTMPHSQLQKHLQMMPIERIKSAEVMYSTPPQYGVRGASINLVLDRKNDNSYSGQIQTGYHHQQEGSWDTGGSVLISNKKWSADLMYNYHDRYSPQRNEQLSVHTVESQTKYINQAEDIYSRDRRHTARAAFNYQPNEKHSLNLVYNGTFTPWAETTANTDGSYVRSMSEKAGDDHLNNISIRYQIDGIVDLGADYTNYNTIRTGFLNNL